MDGNQNGTNLVETTNCTHCGTVNNKGNRFCINCGAALSSNDSMPSEPMSRIPQPESSQQSNQHNMNTQTTPKEKEKNPNKLLLILLGIGSLVLSAYVNGLGMVVFALAIASLFNKPTRAYGITVLLPVAISFAVGLILIVVLFGACFVGL